MNNVILTILLIMSSLFAFADENTGAANLIATDSLVLSVDTTEAFLSHEVARLKEEKNALKDELRFVNIKLASVGAFLGLTLSFLSLFIFLFLRLRRRYRIDTEELKNRGDRTVTP